MNVALQKKVQTLETRTDSLEKVLGQFISSVNKAMIRMEAGTQEMRADTKAFKGEMREFKEEMREFKASTEALGKNMEASTEALGKNMEAGAEALRKEMREFKASTEAIGKNMEADTETFKEKTRAGMASLEKKLKNDSTKLRREVGRLDNKIGMLAEDMVAPNIPGIAAEYFGDEEFESFATRFYRRKSSDRRVRREFDVIAISDRHFLVCEVKSNPRPEYAREFSEMLEELPDFFPETRGRRLIPIFASLTLPGDLVRYLSRKGIYAMGLREDTMDLLNFGEVREHIANP